MQTVEIHDFPNFRANLLRWAATFNHTVFLEDAIENEMLVAIDSIVHFKSIDALPKGKWLFGYISYDYKNRLEDLVSANAETISFDTVFFFEPRLVLSLKKEKFQILYGREDVSSLVEDIQGIESQEKTEACPTIQAKLTKSDYIDSVLALQKHINRGDIYEINFCQEFIAEKARLDAVATYNQLIDASPMSFAAFLKQKSNYALCSSPERYIRRTGNRIISQPIKGTAKRGKTLEEDANNIELLKNNPKERAENVMAVDVVRNDLARVAMPGSVEVDELCEVYTFKQLHQMISTVSANLEDTTDFKDIIRATFPMASMTGAPKISAMKLAEYYENSKRGLYSGTIGYISPNGDFDFNVVIRTILYNALTEKLSFTVGSAITAEAKAEQEYEECLLKAEAIMKVLS